MKKKIIYLSSVDLTIQSSKTFYYNFLNSHFITEFWYLPFVYDNKINQKMNILKSRRKKIFSYNDMQNKLKKEKLKHEVIVVLLTSFDQRTYQILDIVRFLKLKSVYLFGFSLNLNIQNRFEKIKNRVKSFINLRSFFLEFKSTILKKMNKNNNVYDIVDLVIYSGNTSLKYLNTKNKKLKKLEINKFDYCNISKLKKTKNKIKHIIFLDQGLSSNHPDKIADSDKGEGDYRNYFKELDIFFNKIEKFYKLKVVIAKHPKNNLDLEKILQRKTYSHKTHELLANAKFAIAHNSESINYAIYLKKPIIFMYSNYLLNFSKSSKLLCKNINTYSKLVNQKTYNIDDDIKLPLDLKINNKLYNDFTHNFLCSKNVKNNLLISTFKNI